MTHAAERKTLDPTMLGHEKVLIDAPEVTDHFILCLVNQQEHTSCLQMPRHQSRPFPSVLSL